VYRQHLGFAINGRATAEDNRLNIRSLHVLEQCQGPSDVVEIIIQRLRNGFCHRLKSCKVDHGIDLLLHQYLLDEVYIPHVARTGRPWSPGDRWRSIGTFAPAVAKIVEQTRFVASVQHREGGMGSDKSAAAGQ